MKITYNRAYNIGPFLQEKIGFELEGVDEIADASGETLDPVTAVTTLKKMCDEAHKKLNPHLYEGGEVKYNSFAPPPYGNEIQDQQVDRSIGLTVEDIMSCQSLEVIDSYRILVKSNAELQAAYEVRRAEIVKIESNAILAATNAYYQNKK